MADKRTDGYSAAFSTYSGLLGEVLEMEANSRWIEDIHATDLSLEAIYPIEAEQTAGRYMLDPVLTMETALEPGSQLLLTTYGGAYLVRDTALPTLQETAKLSGTALSRMTAEAYSKVMNEGFNVAKGRTLMLERYGKLSACHSGSDSGYEVIPISRLLEITAREAEERFGEIEFRNGYNSHSYTDAWWMLPDAQSRLIDAYQNALSDAGISSSYAISFMPALHFYSSDTANSCASLTPVFMMNDRRPIQLVEGVKVKHSRKGAERSGIEEYQEKIRGVYALFDDMAAAVRRLASVTVFHPENCVISLCRRYGIAKKYGEAAREETMRCLGGARTVNGHDLFLSMTAASAAAREMEASKYTVSNIDEALGRISALRDFREHDVGGTVAW